MAARSVYLGLLVVAACSRPAPPAATRIERVVTLTPSATDIVIALGEGGRLVGRDRFSTAIEARGLPEVGDFVRPNLEAIASLEPDLVILDAVQAPAHAGLRALGIATLETSVHDLDDVSTAIGQVGTALAVGTRSAALQSELETRLQTMRARAGARRDKPRVLVIIDRAPGALRNLIGAGPKSYVGELVELTGGVNVLADAAVLYPKLSPELIVATAPDVIIDTANSDASPTVWNLLEGVPAVQNGRVHHLEDAALRTPTPRFPEALERLEPLLFPR